MPTDETATDDAVSALSADFSRTARALFAAGGVDETLTQLLGLAVATIEGCDFAGVVLIEQGRITSPAYTSPVVAQLHALQEHLGQGPYLDPVEQGTALYADDLAGSGLWPEFGPEATALGVRSMLVLPLIANGTVGALTLYARYPQAFGVLDRARGLLLAALAALAVASAQSHEDDEERAANLHAALATREVIGQAQGILIERERITGDQAFDILRRASQHLNLKLREVAQSLVDTGESPDTGGPRP
jgi:ANTAR domain/GAF domain